MDQLFIAQPKKIYSKYWILYILKVFAFKFRTSPIDSILCYAGELLLKFQRKKDILTYGIKKSTPNHIGYNSIFKNHNINPTNIVRKLLPPLHDTFPHLCNKLKIHTSTINKITFQKCPP